MTPSFHFKILEKAVDIFNYQGNVLLEICDQKVGKEFDIFPYIVRCTLDVILESAMGRRWNIQKNHDSDRNDAGSQYAKALGDICHLFNTRQTTPLLIPDILFNLSHWSTKQKGYLEILHKFTQNVIDSKRQEMKAGTYDKEKSKAFLDALFFARDAEGRGLSDVEIQEEVDTFTFEGHDTTACAISWSLLLLANNPEIQEKAYTELKEVFDHDGDITRDDCAKLKYLDACIKEALRLYPSVPLIGRTKDPNEKLVLDGKVVPEGTDIVVPIMLLHRNDTVWEDPEEFKPERFLSDKERHPYAYVPFSAGPRNCIGMKFAQLEEKTILSKLLLKYKVEAVSRVEDVQPMIEIITRPHGGIKVKLVPRN